MIRGELAIGRISLRRNLVFGRILPDPDHDAVIRIGGEAPGGGPILESGVERHGLLRVAATSDRDRNRRRVRQAPKACRIPPCYAARITTPAGTSPTVTRRHRAMRSLRASATIMVLRVPRRAFAVRTRYHCSQRAVLLEPEEAPSQLNHASPHPSIAGSGEPLLSALPAAFVGRAGDTCVTGNGSSIPHISRQDLVNEHVRGLDADADYARKQAHHWVSSLLGSLCEPLQTGLLNLLDLIPDEAATVPCRDAFRRWYWVAEALPPVFAI